MSPQQQIDRLGELLSPYARRVEAALERLVVEPGTPDSLAEAMRYCTLGGGKRLRPALVLMSARAAGGGVDDLLDRAAAAVEMVHCYSLVHDDLPAMDDDVLRRGRPTAHVKFGQAMAILAGDALLTRAFAIIGESGHNASARLVSELASAAGPAGMIAGQVADMNLCQVPAGTDGLRYIHLNKTAAMIRAALRMGAICGGGDERTVDSLGKYGQSLGLAFQVIDDLLDVTSSAAELGKTPGKDAAAGKRTYATELGLEQTAMLGRRLSDQAAASLEGLGSAGDELRMLARLLAERSR